jgi:ion transport protein
VGHVLSRRLEPLRLYHRGGLAAAAGGRLRHCRATGTPAARGLLTLRLAGIAPHRHHHATFHSSLGHVTLLLSLLLYVYGVIGYHFFHLHDPAHWGTLGRSLLTLFQMLTLEGWIEVRQTSLQAYPWAWIYYGSYIVIAVFIVINLFVAVVLNNMENARLEYELAENNVTHGMSCWPAFAL